MFVDSTCQAYLRLGPDRVPDFATLLETHPPRATVLTYEDWSSLAWYETGVGTVAVVPPDFAKLAFDPALFTGRSQAERRSDLAAALFGDPAFLVSTADLYGADRIVLARRGAKVGLVSQAAAVAAADGRVTGATRIVEGNGWDAVALDPGANAVDPDDRVGPDRSRDPAADAGGGRRQDARSAPPAPRGRHGHRPDGDAGSRPPTSRSPRPLSPCPPAPLCSSKRSTP